MARVGVVTLFQYFITILQSKKVLGKSNEVQVKSTLLENYSSKLKSTLLKKYFFVTKYKHTKYFSIISTMAILNMVISKTTNSRK